MAEAPRNRDKNVTGGGSGVHRRGEGLGTGPVGSGSSPLGGGGNGGGSGRPPMGGGGNRMRGNGTGGGGFGGNRLGIIIAIAVLLLGGGGSGISAILGALGGSEDSGDVSSEVSVTGTDAINAVSSLLGGGSSSGGSGSGSAVYHQVSGSSDGWVAVSNSGTEPDRTVAAGAREKYTNILGNGADTVTIMVYLCGTDLESKYGMATNDLREMMSANISDKVNLIVYTGGCSAWKTTQISSASNQIYRVTKGNMTLLERDMGNKSMTDPETLTEFINYCKSNYPANRNMLIFWDHGGGSLSGYGHDENHSSSGSMKLSGINQALKNAGVKYDFIGFDACLMATVETDLMCASYADYIIASEETEPGIGWYYTDWLNALSANTSMATLDLGKKIIDSYTDECARGCSGQKTTLSIVDLAELSGTISEDFRNFSTSTTELITGQQYSRVSDARADSREFAQSSQIDQIDLVNFALNMGTREGNELATTLLSAVKYNRTSSAMTNAYGISIYFPYRKTSRVSTAVAAYDQLGLEEEYSDCIREFAGIQSSGQTLGGGSESSPYSVLSGSSQASGFSLQSLDTVLELIGTVSGSFSGRSLSDEETASYIYENQFDAGELYWRSDNSGKQYIPLSEEQWGLVHSVDLNMFYDDGDGYIDLGLDNLYSIDDEGNLIADTDGTWISINEQPVAYYHLDTVDDGTNYTITGRVPALLNGERVNLILVFDNAHPHGYIAGADLDYQDGVETHARSLTGLSTGDTLDFLCDYYSYDGSFLDSYYLGDQVIVTEDLMISDTYVGGDYIALYRFTDIYGQEYFSDRLP